jgi:hypothetical protein
MGLPAARPKAMQALRMPEKVATASPLVKLNSWMVAFLSSSESSFSFRMPAQPHTAMSQQAHGYPAQDDHAGVLRQQFTDFAFPYGRNHRAERGAVAQGNGHAQRNTQVTH